MHALHRRDHAQIGEARDVRRIQMLRVLDAPAQVAPSRRLREGPLEHVKRLSISPIADRVDRELESVFQSDRRGALELVERDRVDAATVRLVAVGCEQPGAVRTERAVDRALDRADRQVRVAQPIQTVLVDPRLERVVVSRKHDPQPDADLAGFGHRPEQIDRFEWGTRILKTGDAVYCKGADIGEVVSAGFDDGRFVASIVTGKDAATEMRTDSVFFVANDKILLNKKCIHIIVLDPTSAPLAMGTTVEGEDSAVKYYFTLLKREGGKEVARALQEMRSVFSLPGGGVRDLLHGLGG